MLREYNPNKHYDADYRGEQAQGNPEVLGQLNLFNPPQQPPPFAPPVKAIAAKLDFVTTEEIETLKENINDSFSECVNLYLELRRDLDLILERLDKHNSRSGHKI